PPRHAHLDPPRPEPQRRLDRLAHGAAEGDALLELGGHRLADQLRVELRLLDLEDVDEHLAARDLLQLLPQPIDLGALAADDDARPRRVDVDLELVGRPLDVDARHAGVCEPPLELAPQLQVLVQQLRVILVSEPPRPPRLVEPQPEAVGMNFLTHSLDYSAAFARRRRGAWVSDALRGRSATSTVRWAIRLITRKARPIG